MANGIDEPGWKSPLDHEWASKGEPTGDHVECARCGMRLRNEPSWLSRIAEIVPCIRTHADNTDNTDRDRIAIHATAALRDVQATMAAYSSTSTDSLLYSAEAKLKAILQIVGEQ